MKSENKYTWTASNNGTFLNGYEEGKSLLSCVRAGREYLRGELGGEGEVSIYLNGDIIRTDEKSIFTGYKWATTNH